MNRAHLDELIAALRAKIADRQVRDELSRLRFKYNYAQGNPGYTNRESGNCPICGLTSGFVHVVRARWYFCIEHRTKWIGGVVSPALQRLETDRDWESNAEFLSRLQKVEPRYEQGLEM